MIAPQKCPSCETESTTDDFCNNCGTAMGTSGAVSSGDQSPDALVEAGFKCRVCGTRHAPDDGFCENCGLNFTTDELPDPPPPAGPARTSQWTLVIDADREYFKGNRTENAEPIPFPDDFVAREVALSGDEVIVGRGDEGRGQFPDVDLSRPVADPGVSRIHARLRRQPGGSWALTDENSKNGIRLNDAADPVRPGEPVELKDGDRIHVGAFTVLPLRQHADDLER